jgi:DnaK suppressor protein
MENDRRRHELARVLDERRRELAQEIEGKLRGPRHYTANEREVLDQGESSELDFQFEIGFALLQIKVETLKAIDAATPRLEEGNYGRCVECDDEIHTARLQALPFAVRCRECEATRESAVERNAAQGRGPATFVGLFV